MKDRRRNLHERLVAKVLVNYIIVVIIVVVIIIYYFNSIMEDDSWEDSTLPRPLHTNTVITSNNLH